MAVLVSQGYVIRNMLRKLSFVYVTCFSVVCLLVRMNTCAMFLVVSGNIELNPGPTKKCPQCEKYVNSNTITCTCGYNF